MEHLKVELLRISFLAHHGVDPLRFPRNPCRSPAEFPPNTRRFAVDLRPRLTRRSLRLRSPRAKFNAKTGRGPHDPRDTSAISARTAGIPIAARLGLQVFRCPQQNPARIPIESRLN